MGWFYSQGQVLLPEPALGLPIGALRNKCSQAASDPRLEHARRSFEGLIAPYTPRRCSLSSASLSPSVLQCHTALCCTISSGSTTLQPLRRGFIGAFGIVSILAGQQYTSVLFHTERYVPLFLLPRTLMQIVSKVSNSFSTHTFDKQNISNG